MGSDGLLGRVLDWARDEPNVLAVILTGSRARRDASVDEFSDHDLELITRDPGLLAGDTAWIEALGELWVLLPLDEQQPHPTRLAVYAEGQVDFSLCGVDRVTDMIVRSSLTPLYERGYRVLIDKTGVTEPLPPPTGASPPARAPSAERFAADVREFWFEAAHLPTYLSRGELWVVKLRDWTMKELLLRMLEWHAVVIRTEPVDVWHIGSHLRAWVDEPTWRELQSVFARFDAADSWRALHATTSLYRRLARGVAEALGYDYPEAVDAAITGYVASFQPRPDGA